MVTKNERSEQIDKTILDFLKEGEKSNQNIRCKLEHDYGNCPRATVWWHLDRLLDQGKITRRCGNDCMAYWSLNKPTNHVAEEITRIHEEHINHRKYIEDIFKLPAERPLKFNIYGITGVLFMGLMIGMTVGEVGRVAAERVIPAPVILTMAFIVCIPFIMGYLAGRDS